MKSKLRTLSMAITLTMAPNAFAVFGVGDIVADPGSYVYYAEQIAQMTEQVTALNDMLDNAEKALELSKSMENGVSSMAGDVIGVYNNALDLIDATGALKETTEDLPSSLQNQYFKEIAKSDDSLRAFERMEKFLASNYRDPLSADYDPEKYDLFRFIVEQQAAETVLKTSAQRLDNLEPRVKTIDELANKIDSTENIKDSADLQNRFLAEILIVITEMNDTLQQVAQLETISQFKGYKSTETLVNNGGAPAKPKTELELMIENAKGEARKADSHGW